MAGTRAGGLKAGALNRQRYGMDFYRTIGRKGGTISRGGGFAYNRELAIEAGRKGGSVSRKHGPNVKVMSERITQADIEAEDRPISLLRRMSYNVLPRH